MQCHEIMTPEVTSVSEDDAVLVAADRMRRSNLGFLPVVDRNGRLVGTITDRDIALRLVAEDLPSSTAVRAVMTRSVVACRATDGVQQAAELMVDNTVSRVICLDDRGRPVGVLSLSDLAMWEDERAADTLRRVRERELNVMVR